MQSHWKSIVLAGALLLAPAMGWAVATPIVDVQSLSFDINTLWKLYNTVQQNNNQITEWPQELQDQAGIVVASLKNTDPVNAATMANTYFRVVITETSASCANSEVLQGPVLQLKFDLAPGEMRTVNAASFTLPNTVVNGSFCQAFQDDIKSKLEGIDAGKIQDAIKLFNQKNFQVCLQQSDSAGNPLTGKKACTSLKLFTTNNTINQTIVAMLIYPHNNEVPNSFPNFVWAPAILSSDMGKTDVYYTLEVSEKGQNTPYWSVDIPQPNSQYYQWTGSDRSLEPGKSYEWKVISYIKIGDVKKPIGNNGKGWNISKWFSVKGDAPERCHYTKEDLDRWLQTNAGPDVKAQLKDQTIKGILEVENDPVICRLLAGQVKFTSIKVVKQ